MNLLMQLLIGRELARVKGIEDPGDQFRIGAIAAVMPNPMLGLVLANVIADREAPAPTERAEGPGRPAQPCDTAGDVPGAGEDKDRQSASSATAATPAGKRAS